MGSSAYNLLELPEEIKVMINEAILRNNVIVVGEAHGACRVFQNYLKSINYSNVIVGHAKKIRYNTGNWPETKFGDDLLEREKKMIEYCDYAIIIWVNNSGVIGKNLELLKKLSKPTFIYEYNTKSKVGKFSSIDKNRKYSSLY